MRTAILVFVTFGLWVATSVELAAAGNYTLETQVYVFRSRAVRSIELAGAPVDGSKRPTLFSSLRSARFDGEVLSVENGRIVWSGGKNPPDGFSLIPTPVVSLAPREPVTLRSTVPTEYFEKAADGSLQLRRVAGDSPEAPYYQLTFTLGDAGDEPRGLQLACEIDLALVSGREPIPGVTLNVGKPVLARYRETFQTQLVPGEWAGFVISQAAGSDYGLLGLLKLDAAREGASGLMSAEEFYRFATFYYRDPKPGLIGPAIESLGPSGFVPAENEGHGCIGFFAQVFADNPGRVAEWEKAIDRQDARMRALFRQAVKLSRPGAIAKLDNHSPTDIEVFWGAFFASGEPVYVRKVADELRQLHKGWGWKPGYVTAGLHAAMTLKSNLSEHPVVRATLEEVQTKADEGARKWIDVLFAMDPAGVEAELRGFVRSISADGSDYDYLPSGDGIWGPRRNGSYELWEPSFEATPR